MALAGLIFILLLFAAVLVSLLVPIVLALVALLLVLVTKKARCLWIAAALALVSIAMALWVSHLLAAGAGGLTALEQVATRITLLFSVSALLSAGLRVSLQRQWPSSGTSGEKA